MHGGNDPGASGQGLVEKTVALAVTTRVKYHLERNGQTVFMSRTGDTNPSLTERTNIANRNDVAASISIHCNAFNGTAKGAETYTYGTGSNEMKLANCVHGQIIKDKLFILNRGVKQGNLHMVRETNMAAILVELAFIDNIEDAALLRNKQEEFAIAIAKGA
ncbi:MAG: N-acetylmuramoyl-L-alanine amidase, partial [Anaerovoracaceae bacterium]